jgi:hypothetical protein
MSPAVAVPEPEFSKEPQVQGEASFAAPKLEPGHWKMLVALERGSTASFGLLSAPPRCLVKPGRFSPPG